MVSGEEPTLSKHWVLIFLLILIHFMNLILSPSFVTLNKPLTVGGIETYLFWIKSLLLNPCCCTSFSTFFLCFVFMFLFFFFKFSHIFYKFIWNGGNDRVKRDILCNDYEHAYGGLRMFDLHLFSHAQKSRKI